MIKIFTFSKKKIFFMDIYNSAVFKLLKSWFKNIQMQKNTAEIISARNSQNTSFSQCRETCKCLIRFYSIFLKYGALIGDKSIRVPALKKELLKSWITANKDLEWAAFLFLKYTVTSEIFQGIRYRGRQQLNAKPKLPLQNISWHCLFWNKHKNLDIFLAYDNDLIHFLLRFLPSSEAWFYFLFF